MSVTVGTIKAEVRKILDEISVNEANLIGGTDSANLESIIESKIDDAVRTIYLAADEGLLDTESVDSARVVTEQTSSGQGGSYTYKVSSIKVYLPKKFWRHVSTQLLKVQKNEGSAGYVDFTDGWAYPVTDLISSSDSSYAKLKNQYTTGTVERPKVGFSVTPSWTPAGATTAETSVRTLELYSAKDETLTSSVSSAVLKALVDCQIITARERTLAAGQTVESDSDTYNISEHLERAVEYYVAGLTLLTYKDEHADSLLNIALRNCGAQV